MNIALIGNGKMGRMLESLIAKDETMHVAGLVGPGDYGMLEEIENVDVKGIKAKGKRTVTFVVENGDVVYCKIVGSKPEKITVKGIDKTEKFVQIKGGWIYNK